MAARVGMTWALPSWLACGVAGERPGTLRLRASGVPRDEEEEEEGGEEKEGDEGVFNNQIRMNGGSST